MFLSLTLSIALLSSCLLGFWEVVCNYHHYFSIGKELSFSAFFQIFFSLFLEAMECFEMITFPPFQKHQGFFSCHAYCENLIKLLTVKLTNVWEPSITRILLKFLTLTLVHTKSPQFLNYGLGFPTEYCSLRGFCLWVFALSISWYSVFDCLYLQFWRLYFDLTFLMTLKRKDFSVVEFFTH
jgi:hypothetical protein